VKFGIVTYCVQPTVSTELILETRSNSRECFPFSFLMLGVNVCWSIITDNTCFLQMLDGVGFSILMLIAEAMLFLHFVHLPSVF
jgi:hypothetical protein